MGEIRVFFWGICTYMDREQVGVPASAAWGNRYVLVNASDPATIDDSYGLRDKGIKPHFAELQIAREDIITMTNTQTDGFALAAPIPIPDPLPSPFFAWSLQNVLLSIANPAPGPPPTNPGFPSLSSFILMGPEGPPMPPPSLSMTLNTVPTRAACYFDFFAGPLTAVQTGGGAVIGLLTAETIGDPQIRVRSFASDSATIAIHLRTGSEVIVGNGPMSLADDEDNDFRLHYLTASSFPDVVSGPTPGTFPLVNTYNPPHWDQTMMLTAGCSNSVYP